MIIDKNTVITGSFDFTKAAESKNAENLLIIKSDEIAKLYIENWKTIRTLLSHMVPGISSIVFLWIQLKVLLWSVPVL
jgi:phosphatidylserine/phosphatidylglycerophosphate/cardiolipin synthase-like enzyme